MTHVVRLFAGFAMLLLPAVAGADTGFLDRSVRLNGETFRYQVYVPLEWTKAQKWPVLINLHSNASQGADGLKHTLNRGPASLITAIRTDRTRFPMIALFPQAHEGTRWSTVATQDMVLAQLDATVREFSGDTDRVYLSGHGMGGQGTLRIASRWPDRFAALVVSAGRNSPDGPYTPAQIEADRQAHPYLRASDPYAALAGIIGRLPIWVFHGDADRTIPVQESRQLVAALQVVSAAVRYTEYPGLDNEPESRKVWSEADLTSWLLSQRRKGGKK